MLAEPDMQGSRSIAVRCSGRRVRRTDEVMRSLSTASKEHEGIGGTSMYRENSEPSHGAASEAESEEKLNKSQAMKTAERSSAMRMASKRMTGKKKRLRSNSDSGDVSSDMDDSDELTLKELQVLLMKRKKDVVMGSDLGSNPLKRATKQEEAEKAKTQSLGVQDVMDSCGRHVPRINKGSRLVKECLQPKAVGKLSIWSSDSDEEVEESSSQSDPNAVYCICQQKRNKRFMICCDRCEEWYHGDCVAVTEAHGRMLEKNGKDYICPSCTSHEIQNTVARKTQNIKHPESRTEIGSTREKTMQLVGVEEDQMNSGIEMTTNFSGKEAVDILQPVRVTGLPRCIGPGCSKNALPDSVYCSRDCIVRHAAATMKSLEDTKECKQRPKTDSKVPKSPVCFLVSCVLAKKSIVAALTSQSANLPIFPFYIFTVPNFTRDTCTIPRMLSLLPRLKQQQRLQNPHVPSASCSVVRPPQVVCPPALSKPPNNQIRHNIHRSLKEILYRRVSDSDDLQITESDIGKLAVSIEKEIFNMFLDTDAKYKNKYRSVMFHLKDPKNKALFYRVVCGEVTPYRLVRLTSEQLLCREVPQQMDVKSDQTTSSDTTSKKGLVPDVLCSMLMDTTAEHRRHLFDLNCKICIGCMLSDEQLEQKKVKLSVFSTTHDMEPKEKQEALTCKADSPSGEEDSVVHIGIQNPEAESATSMDEEATKPFISTMTHVGSSYHPSVIVTQTITATPSTTEPMSMTKLCLHSVPVSPVSLPKSVLLKPTFSPDIQSFSASKSSSRCCLIFFVSKSSDGETALCLPKQPILWKGFISMHTVSKFATKACLVSGFFDCLEENLPDTIQIGGRITPQTVWDYVRKLKASFSKELCLIRFYPSSEEEEAAYVSLFSYFSSRGRFGVVANNKPYVKDLYVIPLSAKDPVPCQLLPFHGPGLEANHPHLLLGLVICQKKFSGVWQESEKKTLKITTEDSDNSALQNLHTDIKQANSALFHLHLPASTTSDCPFPSYPSVSLTNSPVSPSVFSVISSKAPSITNLKKESPPPTSTSCAPLQLILNTLFGKKKQDSDNSKQLLVENLQSHALLFDPIVQKFGGVSNEDTEDDRPYDPEEEYNLEMQYGMETATDTATVFPASPLVDVLATVDDVAYDPEDESVFAELEGVATNIPDQTLTETLSEYRITSKSNSSELVQQKRMLEELNKEIELQKQQVEEQEEVLRQQKAVIGLSMAHFSVSDALMSPPSKLLQSNNRLLQLEEEMKHSDISAITQRSDTKKSEDSLQGATNQRVISKSPKKGGIGVKDFAEEQLSGHCLQNSEFCVGTTTLEVSSLEHIENVKDCISSSEEKMNSEKELKFTDEPKVKCYQTSTEGEINADTTYSNSSSTVKANDNNTPFSEFCQPTCMYMADPLIPLVEKAVSDFESVTSQVGASSVYHSYETPLEESQQLFDYFQGTLCTSVTNAGTLPPFKEVGQSMPSPQVLSDTVPVCDMDSRSVEFVECQWSLPKFNTASSNMNYSEPRGSHFSRMQQSNFCNRGLTTAYFPGPRIVPYCHGLQRDPFDSQYDFNNYFMQEVEQHEEQMLLHLNKGSQLSSQGLDTVNIHNRSEGWWNPSQQHFTRFDYCRGPRMFQEQKGLPPSQFSESRRKLQFHLQGQHVQQDGRQLRHSGPLLPTPPQGPIHIHHRRQSSEFCHQSNWLRSSDLRRTSPPLNSEPQNNGYRLSRTEGGHRDRGWIQCPKHWRREYSGEGSKSRREDLQRDISMWRQKYWEREHTTRREADRHRKEGDKKKEKVLKRDQKEDRRRERGQHRKHSDKDNPKNQDRERDQNSRDRRHSLSRSKDRDDRKQRDFGRRWIRDSGQDRDSAKDMEEDYNYNRTGHS
uniref:Death-inducer obliterator 1-like n=1 Tax=Scleropages formosus TaxID=113540 RepID=A0A8C9S520_SCLFO